MMKSNNDSGLTAKRSNRLLAAGLTAVLTAAFFAACSTTNGIPIDDAYYSPDIESPAPATTSAPKTAAPSSSSSQSSASSQSSSSSSSIEYLNVQDTTVTIRIK